jgi:hypothetical protein
MTAPQIRTRIDIEAPAQVVWEILTDLANYHRWNPFVVNAAGVVAMGNRLVCEPQMPGGRRYTFKPVITRLRPEREFAWSGHVLHPRLGSGEHIFQLEALTPQRTRLIHDEVFTGLFAPLVVWFAGMQTTRGFELMNHALKRVAERQVAAVEGA